MVAPFLCSAWESQTVNCNLVSHGLQAKSVRVYFKTGVARVGGVHLAVVVSWGPGNRLARETRLNRCRIRRFRARWPRFHASRAPLEGPLKR